MVQSQIVPGSEKHNPRFSVDRNPCFSVDRNPRVAVDRTTVLIARHPVRVFLELPHRLLARRVFKSHSCKEGRK